MLNLVIVSTLAWIAQDQLQRVDLPNEVFLLVASAVLVFLGAWAAWQSRGEWRAATVRVVALTIGMQAGRFLSDVIAGINWSRSEYWWFWGPAWAILLVINCSLVFLFLFPVQWLRRKYRDA